MFSPPTNPSLQTCKSAMACQTKFSNLALQHLIYSSFEHENILNSFPSFPKLVLILIHFKENDVLCFPTVFCEEIAAEMLLETSTAACDVPFVAWVTMLFVDKNHKCLIVFKLINVQSTYCQRL